ncbi:hypothetical protein AH6C_032 [Aeromonas phage pAh6-C]|uniref:Uncharacterized protein n=1 Tax=Aeromonas phage pAh6-C TaxID=1505227 RepID=A0A076G3P2_9CAUD|nr:hypothetical protein AH6C_032 [Aeromonas phage pAh6-C]AII26786.1 hypothetical protein AH6C_032 [Aeromonas phage pAh6-C]
MKEQVVYIVMYEDNGQKYVGNPYLNPIDANEEAKERRQVLKNAGASWVVQRKMRS